MVNIKLFLKNEKCHIRYKHYKGRLLLTDRPRLLCYRKQWTIKSEPDVREQYSHLEGPDSGSQAEGGTKLIER